MSVKTTLAYKSVNDTVLFQWKVAQDDEGFVPLYTGLSTNHVYKGRDLVVRMIPGKLSATLYVMNEENSDAVLLVLSCIGSVLATLPYGAFRAVPFSTEMNEVLVCTDSPPGIRTSMEVKNPTLEKEILE